MIDPIQPADLSRVASASSHWPLPSSREPLAVKFDSTRLESLGIDDVCCVALCIGKLGKIGRPIRISRRSPPVDLKNRTCQIWGSTTLIYDMFLEN